MKPYFFHPLSTPLGVLYQFLAWFFFSAPVETSATPLGFCFNGDLKSTQFSFRLVENLIIIPVKVNHTMTLQFILDSGSKTPMILHPDLGRQLDLTYGKTVYFSGRGHIKKVRGKMAHEVILQVPGATATGMTLVVLKEDYLKVREFPEKVDGIIGYGLFCRFIVDIDYENLTIRLYDPAIYKPGILFTSLDLELRDTKPFIEALLTTSSRENVKVNLLLDTGAGTDLLLDMHANSGIITPLRKQKRFVGRGLGGIITGKVGKVDRMQIGDFFIEDLPATVTGNTYHSVQKPHQKRHGSIGGGILRQFKQVVFDYAHGKVYIRKNVYLTMNDEQDL